MLAGSEIYFLEKEACMLHHPHTHALLVTLLVANINLHIILIVTGSLIDILFSEAWKSMKLTHILSLVTNPLVGFSRASMTHEGYMTLPVIMGQGINMKKFMVDFLIVNCPSPYNGILG